MSLKEIFPLFEQAIEMEPEELAPFVLKFLRIQHPDNSNINRYNFTLYTNSDYKQYAGERLEEFCDHLMEAWMWLEKEQLLLPKAGTQNDWSFITRRGLKILENQDFTAFKKGSLLPSENLDPVLVQAVKPLFIRGDYDIAIFRAFKEVEIRVRKKGNYSNSDLGTDLMRKAFHPINGPLTDQAAVTSEKEAIMHFFSGAIGKFKNPSSHRSISVDPSEAADLIHLANQLLRIVGDT